MENRDYSIVLVEQFYFCILQPIMMVVLSAKFNILISWSPICTPLILLRASIKLMKLASSSAEIMYNSTESGHPWKTPRIRINGSHRKPFILRLDLGVRNFNHVNEFVTELLQSRKDKFSINSIKGFQKI